MMNNRAFLGAALALLTTSTFSTADNFNVTPVAAAPSVLFSGSNPLLVRIQANAEQTAWDALDDDASPADIMIFLESYPGGANETAAKRRLLRALESELSTNPPEPDPEQPADTTTETEQVDATVEQAALPLNAPAADDGIVRFTVPLFHGESHIAGKTLEELIAGTPNFPPVEGLPEEFWKDQTCSNCHEWTQANLCEQAGFYLREDGKESLTKKHPYGGTFKENLRTWATGDCQ